MILCIVSLRRRAWAQACPPNIVKRIAKGETVVNETYESLAILEVVIEKFQVSIRRKNFNGFFWLCVLVNYACALDKCSLVRSDSGKITLSV